MRARSEITPFGHWLQDTCGARRVTQAELARRGGLNRSSISGVVRGQQRPSLKLCRGIALGLDMPVSEVLHAAEQAEGDPERPPIPPEVRALVHDLETLPTAVATRILAAWRDMIELAKVARTSPD